MEEQAVTAEFEVYNTKDLQIFSLQQFMSQLNYTLFRTPQNGYVFVSGVKNPFPTLSVNTAIELYNGEWEIGDAFAVAKPSRTKVHISVDVYTLVRAAAARIVEKVKIQYSKKHKEIIVLNHMVNFVKPQYQNLFVGIVGVNGNDVE